MHIFGVNPAFNIGERLYWLFPVVVIIICCTKFAREEGNLTIMPS